MNEYHPIDRLGIRSRPSGLPVMYQSWLKLLFMHWEVSPEQLRPHVPAQLEIDTFNGGAWIGITPFALKNLRPVFAPPLPWLSHFHEINLRTYVHYRGVPGIWFFSLDADSILAVLGARLTYHLPYRQAHIRMQEEQGVIFYSSRRTTPPVAEFSAAWQPGEHLGRAAFDTLEFFLVERYCLYTTDRDRLYRARIFHEPWDLQKADLIEFSSTLFEAHGLKKGTPEPLLYCAERQHVAVWPLEPVREAQKSNFPQYKAPECAFRFERSR